MIITIIANVSWNVNLNYALRNTNGEQIFIASEDVSKNEKTSLIRVVDVNENVNDFI